MTESEYWRDYQLTRNEVSTAINSFYTYVEIHNFAGENETVYRTLIDAPAFWNIQLYSLQTTFFIVLGRIFDNGSDVHSIHKLIAATVAHPEYFSKQALAIRKTAGKDKPAWLDSFLVDVYEPDRSDLRTLKKALTPHRKNFDSVYGDIRNHVFAHRILKEEKLISELFSKTLIEDIDDMLYFLYDLLEALQQLFDNGRRPELGTRTYDYKERIKSTTRSVLRQLSSRSLKYKQSGL
jgi:hypothetical protein